MAASTPIALASATAILKELAPTQAIYQVLAQDEPLLGLIKTRSDFYSQTRPVIVNYASNQSVSAAFPSAQAAGGQNAYKRFEVTKQLYYGFVRLSRHLILAAKKDKGAFVDAIKSEVDGVMTTLQQELPFQLYGTGTGVRATAGTVTGASHDLPLADVKDIHKFAVGMRVCACEPTAPAYRVALATNAIGNKITAIDPDSGILTGELAWDAGTVGAVTGDYLVRAGDLSDNITGVLAWVPTVAPAATAFFGVDRTSDPMNLSGHRYDGSALTLQDAILNAYSRMRQFGGKPTHCIVNSLRWTELSKEMDSALVRQNMTYINATNKMAAEAKIGYSAIKLVGNGQEIPVLASPFCPYNNGLLVRPDVWTLDGLGGFPEIITEPDSGQVFHQDPDSDGYEARIGWIGNLECNKLNDQCNVKFA